MVSEQMVPKGYKKTEVGVIPEDWEAKTLGEIGLMFLNGGTPSTKVPEYWNGHIPWITGADIIGQRIAMIRRKITEDAVQKSSTSVIEAGNLLVATRTGVGKLAIAEFDVAISQDLTGVYLDQNLAFTKFIFYVLDHKSDSLKKLNQGTSIAGITRDVLKTFPIPLPPLPEQRAIAAALGDVDALLDALDALIAKKRAVKQAAMQALLTGRVRLPGFSGEWETRRLGDVADFLKGRGLSKSDLVEDGGKPCILYGELFTVYNEVIKEVCSKTNAIDQGIRSISGDVLLPGSTTTTGADLAKASALMLDDVLLGGDIIVIRQKRRDLYCPMFLAYSLTHVYKSEIARKTKGITIHHLHGQDLIDLIVRMPSIEEQRAIAAVLSDMDAEIAALEARREKLRQVKRGMMQVLLTGKVRLVEPEEALNESK